MKKLEWKEEDGIVISQVSDIEFIIDMAVEDGVEGYRLNICGIGSDPVWFDQCSTIEDAKNSAQKLVDSIVGWSNAH